MGEKKPPKNRTPQTASIAQDSIWWSPFFCMLRSIWDNKGIKQKNSLGITGYIWSTKIGLKSQLSYLIFVPNL